MNWRFYRFSLLILTALSLGLLSGCAPQTLTGTWEATDGRPVTLILDEAKNAEIVFEAMGQSISIVGKYKLEQNRLAVSDLKLKLAGEAGMLNLAGMLGTQLPTKADATLGWKNNDEILLSGDKILEGSYRREKQ
jgi:hypothetical protein